MNSHIEHFHHKSIDNAPFENLQKAYTQYAELIEKLGGSYGYLTMRAERQLNTILRELDRRGHIPEKERTPELMSRIYGTINPYGRER